MTEPSTSQKPPEPFSADNNQMIDPFVDFECVVCKMTEKCVFGELKVIDVVYKTPVYYMRDPFYQPPRDASRKPQLDDFLVLGSACHLCNQPVCISPLCSFTFGNTFCAFCVYRERRRFPKEPIARLVEAFEKRFPGEKEKYMETYTDDTLKLVNIRLEKLVKERKKKEEDE